MSRLLISFLLGCLITGGLAVWIALGRLGDAHAQANALEKMVSDTQSELLGYTRYTTYLGAGKASLSEQVKLIASSVTRDESQIQVVEKSVLGLTSNALVSVSYTTDYAFGYDLRPEAYELRATQDGIEVRIGRPTMVATPAVRNLKYEILAGGVFTDEKGAVLRLYEQSASRATQAGKMMEQKPEIAALCEKKLIAFLRDFLSRQPGVKHLPQIRVVYK
ncbi:MAG TPA: hypothetical protein VGN52_16950 [Burkholderiales bacterium]|jgi:hypothetical protein